MARLINLTWRFTHEDSKRIGSYLGHSDTAATEIEIRDLIHANVRGFLDGLKPSDSPMIIRIRRPRDDD